MPYSSSIPAPSSYSGNIPLPQTVTTSGTGGVYPIVEQKQVKGGLHYVEYLEYLQENSARGVSTQRRVVGMLAFVERHYNGGTDTVINRYYTLKSLSPLVWEATGLGGGGTISPGRVEVANNIAARDAFIPTLTSGDIVIVADASDDPNAPALEGAATYAWNGTTFLRLLYPDDYRLNLSHAQNTDTAFHVNTGGGTQVMSTTTVYDHINNLSIHFAINDLSLTGSTTEVFSSAYMNARFIKKNPLGATNKFFNELGDAVAVQATITRINGGRADTQF